MKWWGTRLAANHSIQTGRQATGRSRPGAISLIGGAVLVLWLAACSNATTPAVAGQVPEPTAGSALAMPAETAAPVEPVVTPADVVVEATLAPAVTPSPRTEVGSDDSRDMIEAMTRALGNLSYEGILPTGAISLTDGLATYDDGSSINPFVRLMAELVATGDLNGDGAADAVAVLDNQSSGSGRFVYLVAVLNGLADPKPTGALLLGDRVQIKSLVVDGTRIVADMVVQGAADPLCCPSQKVRKVFGLEDGQLVEQSSEDIGQVMPDDSNGG